MTWFPQTFPEEVTKLQGLYAEPHRAYHTWEHIEALLAQFARLDWADPKGVEIAVYYHDAIYNPLAATNEADSAELMIADLTGKVDQATLDHANALILATAGHKVPEGADDGLAFSKLPTRSEF